MKYDKLVGGDYDKEKVEQLAEALAEMAKLESKIKFLKDLIDENSDTLGYVWRSKDGKYYAHHLITDDHLKSIVEGGYANSKSKILAEYVKRFGYDSIPESVNMDDDDFSERDLPF